MNIVDVLCTNYSGKSWKLTSPDDYSALEWYDASEKPTEEKLRSEISTLENAEPMRRLRIQRDALLKETDWMASSDYTISDAWKTYRQALRDLPANNKNASWDGVTLSNVTFPTKPTE